MCGTKGLGRKQWHTIGEAGEEVEPESPVEQRVGLGQGRVEMLFCVEHQKEGEEGRERKE
jgi:hypothetical protein